MYIYIYIYIYICVCVCVCVCVCEPKCLLRFVYRYLYMTVISYIYISDSSYFLTLKTVLSTSLSIFYLSLPVNTHWVISPSLALLLNVNSCICFGHTLFVFFYLPVHIYYAFRSASVVSRLSSIISRHWS